MEASLLTELKAQYLIDNKGNKTGVLLDIKTFEALIEKLEDLYDITEAEKIIEKKGKKYTLEEVEKSLSEE